MIQAPRHEHYRLMLSMWPMARSRSATTARRRRIEFLDFMNRIIADQPGREIHVILDNLSTHKPKCDRWLTRHKNVHFHFTPTHASWLNPRPSRARHDPALASCDRDRHQHHLFILDRGRDRCRGRL
jgi:DDE superfamily endonuclease